MTRDEFVKAYRDYAAATEEEALAEAASVSVEGDNVVVVGMGELGYCLMLESAFLTVQGCMEGWDEQVLGGEETNDPGGGRAGSTGVNEGSGQDPGHNGPISGGHDG